MFGNETIRRINGLAMFTGALREEPNFTVEKRDPDRAYLRVQGSDGGVSHSVLAEVADYAGANGFEVVS